MNDGLGSSHEKITSSSQRDDWILDASEHSVRYCRCAYLIAAAAYGGEWEVP